MNFYRNITGMRKKRKKYILPVCDNVVHIAMTFYKTYIILGFHREPMK